MKQTAYFIEHVPPRLEDVKTYFSAKKMNAKEAEHFFMFWELSQWKTNKGDLVYNWKKLAYKWIIAAFKLQQQIQITHQIPMYMKNITACLLILVSLLIGACKKDIVPAYSREKPHAALLAGDRALPPFRPDTMRMPVFPRLPIEPIEPLLLSRCVYSYEDLIAVLGTDRVQAKAVVLENDVRIEASADLAVISYSAHTNRTGSSLFNSFLAVEWRPSVNDYWSGFTADVWSVGCVYMTSAVGPFTNLIKDGVVIEINTCFFWSYPPYQHMRIKYLIVD